jgi:hypothetical protein
MTTDVFFPSRNLVCLTTTPCFIKNALFVTSIFNFAVALLSRPILMTLLTDVYVAAETLWFSAPVHSVRLCLIQKRVTTFSKRGMKDGRPEARMIEAYCLKQFRADRVTVALIEAFSAHCTKRGEPQKFFNAVREWLPCAGGPSAVELAEAVALYAVASEPEAPDVETLLPIFPSFFALFNAVATAERKRRGLGHQGLRERFRGVYNRALELLDDPKLRIFSPVLAMFAEDTPVPAELETFFVENTDRIQRAYEAEAAHEW